jgi:hypothetical protein
MSNNKINIIQNFIYSLKKALFFLILPWGMGLLLISCTQQNPSPENTNNNTDTTEIKENNNSDAPENSNNDNSENDLEEDEFTFSITNNNSGEIKGLFIASENDNWETFELGGETIKPQEKVVLLWTKDTKELGCQWQMKATFNDGKESDPLPLNICEQPDLIFPQK